MFTGSGEFIISLDDSLAFARLSGDYNPLHVDPVAARRLRFGGTVAHGIHLFLRALDDLAAQRLLDRQQPEALFVSFHSPILTGARVAFNASASGNTVRLSAEVEGRAAFSGTIELRPASGAEPPVEDAEFAPACPGELDFPPSVGEGSVSLKRSHALCTALFPSLNACAAASCIAELLATTHIVGMRCPGMHSVYSCLRLRRTVRPADCNAMHYQVIEMQERMQMLRIRVRGACFEGTIDALFRPRPVAQRAMTELATVVSSGAFVGHRVLIVGGSRGLGELTAKLVAAAGAEVTITYARGKEDADRICAEARALEFSCNARQLDVAELGARAAPQWLTSSDYSHVYFFASPPISKNTGRWNDALFEQFTQVYVTAFANLVEHTCAARRNRGSTVRFLYPSSVFVDQPEGGFSEYAVAKAAGEALCDQLQRRRGVEFSRPRLPRMPTDQTSSLVDIGAVDPVPIMLEVVRSMHAS